MCVTAGTLAHDSDHFAIASDVCTPAVEEMVTRSKLATFNFPQLSATHKSVSPHFNVTVCVSVCVRPPAV